MKKYIFVTGGVVSGLGKGLIAASIGRLLKNKGFKVYIQKFDPYLNSSPSTMDPKQHGEIFVTADGGETDLDLGHYERFIDEDLSKEGSLSSGKVYSRIFKKEANGAFGGATIQIFPHVTNEIIKHLEESGDSNNADIVIIDTAGRLHNKVNLMNELSKIKRVMQKISPDAPHEILLVLDGSTGQNAFEQAKQFIKTTEVTALALTKLDGTAKGGVVIGISDQFKIPVKYIGVGEKIDDLQLFRKKEFVDSLFGE